MIDFPKKAQTKKIEKKEVKDDKPLPEINIGLVGHVDHGKTSVTASLTGKWTDTHSEELKRGITIRLGYADVAFYKCSKCKDSKVYGTSDKCINCFSKAKSLRTVSFVDVPGHETLMTTVLSGASLIDGALLVISANEPCPQPQTREHLTALDIIGVKNIVVVQNKIDLVSKEQALENYEQIKTFLKGSIAESAPVIPLSAQQRINLDALIEAIEGNIPTPKRDPKKDPKMLIARSFDINKPGTSIEKLMGGVVGGSLIEGELKKHEEVEIKPGIKIKDEFKPITTKITGLHKAKTSLDKAGPGGLLGLQTNLDPYLTKSDTLSGNVLGIPGKLPPVHNDISITMNLFERVVGSKEELKVEPIKAGDVLMLALGISRTIGSVTSVSSKKIQIKLKLPVCAEKNQRVSISRQVSGRWRLIGWGEVI